MIDTITKSYDSNRSILLLLALTSSSKLLKRWFVSFYDRQVALQKGLQATEFMLNLSWEKQVSRLLSFL